MDDYILKVENYPFIIAFLHNRMTCTPYRGLAGISGNKPQKTLKGWIAIPAKYSGKWTEFARMALKYVLVDTVKE